MEWAKWVVSKITVRAIVTVSLWGAVIYQAVSNQPVNDALVKGAFMGFGYYVGSNAHGVVVEAVNNLRKGK
ncbi:MAG: hypothetical protein HWN68_11830 [Desulfobacterales bacterium]|nr:hypothetical protein [Desulfobacterales bacterium]